MSEACFECKAPIEPFRGGYPGGMLIPWHPQPSGVPCAASQTPYRAAIGPAPGQAVQTAQNAVKSSPEGPVLAYKASHRTFLIEPSPDANIKLWMDLVEEQSKKAGGEPLNLAGDAYCIMEELGEAVEAMFNDDQPMVEDGLCDSYVAIHVGELLLRREFFAVSGYAAKIQPWDSLPGTSICSIAVGRLASWIRKPKKRTPEKAKAVLDSLLTAKAAIKRDVVKELGVPWNDAIGRVLDILDKRLGEGYTMVNGAAVKASDQK